jgi:hypothetical protein
MALSAEQRRNVEVALRVARREGASRRVRKALLEAMSVESNFRHLDYGMDDSEGVLQQRPSQGWGPATDSVKKDVRDFLERAIPADRGFRGSAGQLAQSVQRSAYPDRYDERAAQASRLLRRFGGGPAGQRRGGNRGIRSASLSPGLLVEALATAAAAQQQRPQIPMAGLAAPEFSAGVVMPQGARLPQAGGGPAPKDPTADLLSSVLPAVTGLGARGQARGRNRPGGGAQRGRGGQGAGRARAGQFKRSELLELYHDPGINVDEGRRTDPIGNHGGHVHVAAASPAAVKAAARLAFSMGLEVRENPKWDPVDPVHSSRSFHDRRFPRRPRLGMAIDVSGGTEKRRLEYNRRVARMFGA